MSNQTCTNKFNLDTIFSICTGITIFHQIIVLQQIPILTLFLLIACLLCLNSQKILNKINANLIKMVSFFYQYKSIFLNSVLSVIMILNIKNAEILIFGFLNCILFIDLINSTKLGNRNDMCGKIIKHFHAFLFIVQNSVLFYLNQKYAIFIIICQIFSIIYTLLNSENIKSVNCETQINEIDTIFNIEKHICIYKKFFMSLPQPAFIIDLNETQISLKPSILNPAAENAIKSSVDRFFETIKLEVASQTLNDYINNLRRNINNTTLKWDKAIVGEEKDLYEISGKVFDDENEIRKLGLIMFEPPKNRRREKELIKHFRSSLICSLSHELCTPMNSLMPLLKMLPKCPTNDRNDDLKEIALSSAELLYSKIRDLMDYNKIEMAELKLEDSEFFVSELFRELENIFKYEVLYKHNSLEFIIDDIKERKLAIYTDRARLKQILVKLIYNANKYTTKGKIIVSAIENQASLDVEFNVKDTGIGMSQKTLDFVFCSLQEKAKYLCRQENESTKLPGLGLGIAKNICEALGSQLHVISEENKGTLFSFILQTCRIFSLQKILDSPKMEKDASRRSSFSSHKNSGIKLISAKRSSKILTKPVLKLKKHIENSKKDSSTNIVCDSQRSTQRNQATPKKSLRELKIKRPIRYRKASVPPDTDCIGSAGFNCTKFASGFLEAVNTKLQNYNATVMIVDDVYGNRVVLREMLKRYAVKSVEAGDGSEALDLYRKSILVREQEKIQLIFMDLNMPIMDGIQATVAIRSFEYKERLPISVPIIAVTANNNEEDKAVCYTCGMNDYISKPVSQASLKEALKKFLKSLEI